MIKNIADIWEALDSHFGNAKHILDATIITLFSISECTNNIAGLKQHFIKNKNAATDVVNLSLNLDQLLASIYMLQVPDIYR